MQKNIPPWMQKKKENDPQMEARKNVAAKRLAKLKGQPAPKGK